MTESTLGLGQERKRWAVGLACSAIVLMLGGLAGEVVLVRCPQ